MRRAPHEGQSPRRLQLNASSLSWPHSPQRGRKLATEAVLQAWDDESSEVLPLTRPAP